MSNEFRAPAVPLITHDPNFSVWSFSSKLSGDVTRHWSGQRQYMTGMISIDGVLYEFMGKALPLNECYSPDYPKMEQKSCEIRPMSTRYVFEADGVKLELSFISPLVLGDLELLSRPASYIKYKLTSSDGKKRRIKLYFGFSGEFCVDRQTGYAAFGETEISTYATSGEENMLSRDGDDLRIEWGTFHVVAPQTERKVEPMKRFAFNANRENVDLKFSKNQLFIPSPRSDSYGPEEIEYGKYYRLDDFYPTVTLRQEIETDDQYESFIMLCYDDIKPLEYFGNKADPYWKKYYPDFSSLMKKAYDDFAKVEKTVEIEENKLIKLAGKISPKYAQILSLAYRQAVAAHKLAIADGEEIFISKENFSNGCACTVDVTYPSIPIFLLCAPVLVRMMLDPVFRLVEKGLWQYEFAPHDIGRYPRCNGQAYGFLERYRKTGRDPMSYQMPVEECGNMILCVAAYVKYSGDTVYFERRREQLTKWADYLTKTGLDPENQLCTDDFAGHLAHNCNLSVKAICALAAFGKLLGKDGGTYVEKAREMAEKWEANALDKSGDHYKLAFDQEGTWSIKYNLVWDKLFGLGLFSEKVYKLESGYYLTKFNKYGLPLDSRSDYTKSDWQMWATLISDDRTLFDRTVDCMWDFLCDTPDRVPFTDWYFTSRPYERGFQARSVQGGLFIKLLENVR